MTPEEFFALARKAYLHPGFSKESHLPWLDMAVMSALRSPAMVSEGDANRLRSVATKLGIS